MQKFHEKSWRELVTCHYRRTVNRLIDIDGVQRVFIMKQLSLSELNHIDWTSSPTCFPCHLVSKKFLIGLTSLTLDESTNNHVAWFVL